MRDDIATPEPNNKDLIIRHLPHHTTPPKFSPKTINRCSRTAIPKQSLLILTSLEARKDGPPIRPHRRALKPYAPLFSSTTFKPCHMFFYGTLMDPEVLQRITRCPSKPTTRPGWITGFKPKMWYTFPTLIPFDELGQDQCVAEEVLGKGEEDVLTSEPSVKIRGMFWKVEDYQHFWELQRYETSPYHGHWCQIHVEDLDCNNEGESILSDGVVFVWAKNPQSPDLTDGKFDLARWQKTHKSSLFTPTKYYKATRP
ncbi:hypothetical protein HD806DRAFT_530740 [Xylariaceae sp. AK1471]|nr:hypothetical protein HD806DRAFT_530740 [Xylariaceae sp. AK1471]